MVTRTAPAINRRSRTVVNVDGRQRQRHDRRQEKRNISQTESYAPGTRRGNKAATGHRSRTRHCHRAKLQHDFRRSKSLVVLATATTRGKRRCTRQLRRQTNAAAIPTASRATMIRPAQRSTRQHRHYATTDRAAWLSVATASAPSQQRRNSATSAARDTSVATHATAVSAQKATPR